MRLSSVFERAVIIIETIAAAMLGLITLLIVASAIGRYALAMPVPDAFDVSRLLIGAAIVWGLASVGYRGSHIKVDLLAEMLSPRARRLVDIVAWTVLFGFTVVLSFKMYSRMASAAASGEATFDLRLPVWPFLALILAGALASILTVAARIVLMARGQGMLDSFEPVDIGRKVDDVEG